MNAKRQSTEILLGETTPLDESLAPSQVWVNEAGDPIEIIAGCETLGYSLSEARDLYALLGRAIRMVEERMDRQQKALTERAEAARSES